METEKIQFINGEKESMPLYHKEIRTGDSPQIEVDIDDKNSEEETR